MPLCVRLSGTLPADIRHTTDTSVFKRHLKMHFLNLYFNT